MIGSFVPHYKSIYKSIILKKPYYSCKAAFSAERGQ